MASPTTGILDDFNRADNPSSLGANWSAFPLGGSGRHNIASNQAAVQGTGYHADFWNPSTFGPDSECYFTAKATGEREIYVRAKDEGASNTTDCYSAYGAATGTNNWGIYQYTNGSFTLLGANFTMTFVSGDQLFLEAISTTITLYKNGTSIASRTDSTWTGSGHIGWTTGVVATGASDDDYGGGTVVGGGGGPTAHDLGLLGVGA